LRLVRTFVIVFVSCAALLGSCAVVFLWRGPPCLTETRNKIADLSGYNFEISDTYCSAIAHTASMSVYGAKKGERKQTLLFKFDPIDWIDLPTISIPDEDRLVISVPWVSSIFERRFRWHGMQIEYDIGKVTNPGEGRRLADQE
jgi:hypothetical protein